MEGKADAEDILSFAGDAPRANKAALSRTSTLLLSWSGNACGNSLYRGGPKIGLDELLLELEGTLLELEGLLELELGLGAGGHGAQGAGHGWHEG
jgi:hypothetical protein